LKVCGGCGIGNTRGAEIFNGVSSTLALVIAKLRYTRSPSGSEISLLSDSSGLFRGAGPSPSPRCKLSCVGAALSLSRDGRV